MREDLLDSAGNIRLKKMFPPAFRKGVFLNCPARYRIFKGARNTGKSYSMIGYESLLKIISDERRNVVIVRQNMNSNKGSTYENICGRIMDLGWEKSFKMKENPAPEITYKPTGQKIVFKGLNDPTTLTSITFAHGYLTDIYIEEAFEVESYADFRKLDGSLRGKLPDGLYLQITLCFNAWSQEHWIYERFFKDRFEDNYEELDNPNIDHTEYKDLEWMGDFGKGLYMNISTYKSNIFRDPMYDISAEEMKKRSLDIYKVEYLGMWGNSTATTYPEFKDACIMSLADIGKKYRFSSFALGIDTGLSNGEGGRRTVGKNQTVEERVKSATVMTLTAVSDDFETVAILDEYFHTEIERNGVYNTDTPYQIGEPALIKTVADYVEKWIRKYQNANIGLFQSGVINIYVDSADIGFRQMLEFEFRTRGMWYVNVYLSTKMSTQTRVDFEKVMMAWGNFIVCDQCKNVIREFKNARRDKKGRAREDNDDHALTSLEYGYTPLLGDVRMWKQFKERK